MSRDDVATGDCPAARLLLIRAAKERRRRAVVDVGDQCFLAPHFTAGASFLFFFLICGFLGFFTFLFWLKVLLEMQLQPFITCLRICDASIIQAQCIGHISHELPVGSVQCGG